MGKRKKSSRKPEGPKKREPLATTFTCLFCNHEKAIQVKLEKKIGIGTLSCKVCGQRFQCVINYLSAPVDVYSEWIDACETVAQTEAEKQLGSTGVASAGDLEFSTYAAGDERRKGAAGGGDDDDILNDDEY